MSSPSESGRPGDRPAVGDGPAPAPAPGPTPPSGDVPPWPAAPRPPGGNPRASRYVTGIAAPDLSGVGAVPQRPEPEPPVPARVETRTQRTDVVEAYPSELPDLSGPVPKPPQHRHAAVPDVPRPPVPRPAAQVAPRAPGRGPLRAGMQIRRIDPWSMLKVSGLLSVALFFVWMIAVAFLYLVLGAMGVWSKLNSNVGDLLTTGSSGGGDIVSAGSVFGSAALIGLVNIVLLTAMATVGAYIYNLSTDIVGGVEVTLADLD